MSYRTQQSARSAILALFLAGTALLGACGPHRTAGATLNENEVILQEIDLGSTFVSSEDFIDFAGPDLIAGDWLAIQCASIGGYFDKYIEDADWSPVYASVETSE